MSEHTPGPWTENACEVQAPDGTPICEMFSRPEDSGVNYPYAPEADANSRLICAAPDLLAALERIAWTECGAFAVQIARKAVVKAKGGE
tara:strand:- start:1302 stop:1568 length:267 start_codon:yes stop_codon:yes gene_type:complete